MMVGPLWELGNIDFGWGQSTSLEGVLVVLTLCTEKRTDKQNESGSSLQRTLRWGDERPK